MNRTIEKSKNTHAKNYGFSLVELIIVVAILAILTGILAPQLTRYIERSRKAVCLTNMDTIIGEYQVAAIEKPPLSIEEAKALLESVVTQHGGKIESGNTSFYTGGFYSGFCKSGGIYNGMFSENFTYLSIDCTKHGEGMIDVETLYERLENIIFNDMPDSPYKKLSDYFSSSRPSIDSEAVGTDARYKPYKSLADAVNHKLIQQGINTTSRSWRLYKKGETYNLFLTERTITAEDAASGTWVACDKYDVSGTKTTSGYIQVITSTVNGNTFPVIKGDSFRENKP